MAREDVDTLYMVASLVAVVAIVFFSWPNRGHYLPWFARAFIVGAVTAVCAYFTVPALAPGLLADIGLTAGAFVFWLAGGVALGTAAGIGADLYGWLAGERREPPPPFG